AHEPLHRQQAPARPDKRDKGPRRGRTSLRQRRGPAPAPRPRRTGSGAPPLRPEEHPV
ncbi:MAG: Glutamyl-tRNA reductase, partial [uncultured Rubrobacteraceae bacterium]